MCWFARCLRWFMLRLLSNLFQSFLLSMITLNCCNDRCLGGFQVSFYRGVSLSCCLDRVSGNLSIGCRVILALRLYNTLRPRGWQPSPGNTGLKGIWMLLPDAQTVTLINSYKEPNLSVLGPLEEAEVAWWGLKETLKSVIPQSKVSIMAQG